MCNFFRVLFNAKLLLFFCEEGRLKKINTHLLKTNREKKGYTQEDIARAVKITLRTYQKIEQGEVEPRIKKALLICIMLNLSPFAVWLD